MKKESVVTETTLRRLQSEGYVFRLPGGSSRNGEHASLAVVYEYEWSHFYFLVIPYNPKIRIERKYEKIFDEAPEGTLELKVLEQTGVRIRNYRKIGLREEDNNKEEVQTEKHIKHVFSTEFYDDSNIRMKPSPDGRLGAPLWIEQENIKKFLFPGHFWAMELFGKDFTPNNTHVETWE